MNKKIKSIIGTIQELPIPEQLELMQAMVQSLYLNYQHTLFTRNFKKTKTIMQLVKTQKKTPVTNLSELAADFWPDEELSEDFIDYTYKQRQEDRVNA